MCLFGEVVSMPKLKSAALALNNHFSIRRAAHLDVTTFFQNDQYMSPWGNLGKVDCVNSVVAVALYLGVTVSLTLQTQEKIVWR